MRFRPLSETELIMYITVGQPYENRILKLTKNSQTFLIVIGKINRPNIGKVEDVKP